jgi:hypothetical protein
MNFCSAAIEGGKAPLRVIHDISCTFWGFRFTPVSNLIAALRQAPLGPDLPIGV